MSVCCQSPRRTSYPVRLNCCRNLWPFLVAGTPYWLVVRAPASILDFSASFTWNASNIPESHLVLRSDDGEPFVQVRPGIPPAYLLTGSPEPIPEPATISIVGIGLFAVAALKRRRRTRHVK